MSILALIGEAQAAGAGFEQCCETLDLHPRTVQRWKVEDGGEDKRNGPKTEPKNKLSPGEREKVLQVVTSPTYRDLSPKQIVPDLADRGVYLASRSHHLSAPSRRGPLWPPREGEASCIRPSHGAHRHRP